MDAMMCSFRGAGPRARRTDSDELSRPNGKAKRPVSALFPVHYGCARIGGLGPESGVPEGHLPAGIGPCYPRQPSIHPRGRRNGMLDSGSVVAWTSLWWASAAGRFRDFCDGKDKRDGAAMRSHPHGKRLGRLRVCPEWIGSGWLRQGEEYASMFQRSSSPAGAADSEPTESPPSAASGAFGAVLGFA